MKEAPHASRNNAHQKFDSWLAASCLSEVEEPDAGPFLHICMLHLRDKHRKETQ